MNIDDDISTLLILFYDYIELNPTSISDPNFEEIMIDEIFELISISLNDDDYISNLIEETLPLFYETLYVIRSQSLTYTFSLTEREKEIISFKLNKILNMNHHQQKSNEWYNIRNNLLTASNAYKIFESNSQQNSLIYEKCKTNEYSNNNKNNVNIDSTLHWGNKYEPLSILFYEHLYFTTIKEVGCIQHPKYKFLGASPDGINIDISSDRFGRLLEIKNIINRDITGIPKKEYWIQTQLQMETLDLNECDFLETRFIEYSDEYEFLRDSDTSLFISKNGDKKGIILYFNDTVNNNPYYIYTPLNLSYDEYEIWSEKIIEETINSNPNLLWIKHIFWKLDEISCVLINRNRKWFNDVVPIMEEFWNTIQREKISGYEHRAPKRKT
jgi:hypothetical protein